MSDSNHYQYLIIGADAAGLSAAVQIRGNQKEASIGILEKGEIISYGACGLPYAIEKKIDSFDKLIHFSPEKFSGQYRADIHTSTEATELRASEKTVIARSGTNEVHFTYDKLLIATGATPIRIPSIDYSSSRIFELKSIPDGKRIAEALEKERARRVVIAGAGYIGLELADILTELDIQVVVIDALDRPAGRMSPPIGNAIIKKMEEKGIDYRFGSKIESVTESENGIQAHIPGEDIDGDLLITGIGVRPATDFLQGSGVEMEKGAIVVNAKGETSLADVYAAGDCAMVPHILLEGKPVYMPLGSTANKQGRIAGMNLSGESIEFPGIVGTQIFKFFDLALAQTGLSEEQAKEAGYDPVTVHAMRTDRAGYYPGARRVTVYLVVDQSSQRILGGSLVGSETTAAMIDTIGVMAQNRMKASETAYFDAAYAPPFAPVWSAVISAAGKFGR